MSILRIPVSEPLSISHVWLEELPRVVSLSEIARHITVFWFGLPRVASLGV